MGIIGWIFNSQDDEPSDYDRGYDASEEFSDIVNNDDSITDEQIQQQYNIVLTTHSSEYAQGYSDYIDDELEQLNKPWWKVW